MNFQNDKSAKLRSKYARIVSKYIPSSPILKDCVKSFLVGGLICVLGQCFNDLAQSRLFLGSGQASAFTSIVLVFLGAFFTGLGWYDKLGLWAGAGSAVPITGFANSVVAPAMEFRQEGLVMGVGARIFSIAGPVLVHGLLSSMIMTLFNMILGRLA